MGKRRSYGEACAAAHALDIVGERWALLVVRELLLGPKRFTDLRAGILHASPNVLAQRLRELEQAGVVRRRRLPPPAASRVYELTEWGKGLEPVIIELGRWATHSPELPRDAEMSVDSHVLAMRTLFDAEAAAGFEARFELRLGEDRFRAELADGRFEIDRGCAERPDATIETDPGTLAGLLWEGRDLRQAQQAGAVTIGGDEQAVARYLRLFPLPGQAASSSTSSETPIPA